MVFPAYAGVIPRQARSLICRLRLSRIRGGDPLISGAGVLAAESFPHTRG